MSPYDPRFWEVCVDPRILASLAEDARLGHQEPPTEEDEAQSRRREGLKRKAIGQIRTIIETRLTEKQRRIVDLRSFPKHRSMPSRRSRKPLSGCRLTERRVEV